MVVTEGGLFRSAPLDSAGEETVEISEWLGATRVAETLAQRHWGKDRAGRLATHHQLVQNISSDYNWPTARKYDITMRRRAIADSTHDLATLDALQLSAAVAEFKQPKQPSAANWVAASTAGTPWTSSSLPFNNPGKRSRPTDDAATRPSKFPKTPKCFRCGTTGHNQGRCTATTTSSGRPCAAIVSKGKSSTLITQDGAQFCFNWERGECRFGPNCVNTHLCSLCNARDHGAAFCPGHL